MLAMALAIAAGIHSAAAAPGPVLDVRDLDGYPAAGVRGVLTPTTGGASIELQSDEAGITAPLTPGSYRAVWYYGGISVATGDLQVMADTAALRVNVPLVRFAYEVYASNGDPLLAARAELTSAGASWTQPLVAGHIVGLAAAGTLTGAVIWQGARVELPPLHLPEQRQGSLRIDLAELEVRVQQQGTGIGFGPARIYLGSPGVDAADQVRYWTDAAGVLRLLYPVGPVQIAAEWFGERIESVAEVPGSARLVLPLATRSLPLPEAMQAEGGTLKLKQPGFEIWVAAAPGVDVRLPLAVGNYDVVAHDSTRKPRAAGVLQVVGTTAAKIDWQPIAGDVADSVRERRLVWPQAILKQAPSAAIATDGSWRELNVAADGGLGMLPAGLDIRVPAHALGRLYSTDTEAIPVQVGVLEVYPPRAGRIKLIDPFRPGSDYVSDCTPAGCRIVVAPGSYWIWAAGAQLMQTPAQVADGEVVTVTLDALEAVR